MRKRKDPMLNLEVIAVVMLGALFGIIGTMLVALLEGKASFLWPCLIAIAGGLCGLYIQNVFGWFYNGSPRGIVVASCGSVVALVTSWFIRNLIRSKHGR